MDITSSQANAVLSDIHSEEGLLDLVRNIDIQAEGKITILYSGYGRHCVQPSSLLRCLCMHKGESDG